MPRFPLQPMHKSLKSTTECVFFTCLWPFAVPMCRGGCHFHFLLAQHVLRRQLRFTNQPCMFSEVTKTCVPLGCRVCFDGFKLKKKRAQHYGNRGERSPSPTGPTRMAAFLPPPPHSPIPVYSGWASARPWSLVALKPLKCVATLICLGKARQVRYTHFHKHCCSICLDDRGA